MAKIKNNRALINKVINSYKKSEKKEIAQLTIKIDKKIDNALATLSTQLNISKNRLIEDILSQSGIVEEVDENYTKDGFE